MTFKTILNLILIFITFLKPLQSSFANNEDCKFDPKTTLAKLVQIENNRNFVKSLSYCEKSNRQLIAELINLDYRYFNYAAPSIKNDETFIKRFIISHPQIMEYVNERIKDDEFFMYEAVKLYPEILKYASLRLIDNKVFMSKMIKINPHNFVYASQRLQNDYDVTLLAVKGNGEVLKYASERMMANKNIVKEAVRSYTPTTTFISRAMKNDPDIMKISSSVDYRFMNGIDFFLKKNYAGLPVGPGGVRGYRIVNRGKFFSDRKIMDYPYIIRWQTEMDKGNEDEINQFKLLSGRGGYIGWKSDFKRYPKLIRDVEKILTENGVDQNTIDSLSVTSLWEVDDNPKTVAFDLYLLRNIKDQYSRPNFANVTLLTAIAIKEEDSWKITVIHSMFDIDMEVDIGFKNGHKRYIIWDFYKYSTKDKDLKILFKVEDKDSEYFNLFVKQPNNKYVSFYEGGGYNVDNY